MQPHPDAGRRGPGGRTVRGAFSLNLLREPLVQFLLIGAALFAFGRARGGTSAAEIVVSRGKIDQLTEQFRAVWLRPPTRAELDGLISGYVKEEIFYRQALAMGLDQDDQVIRRRLTNKLQFVSEDLANQTEPSDSELVAWMQAHPEAVRREPVLSFAQVYVATDRRGDDGARAEAARLLSRLRSAGPGGRSDGLGDRTMLEPEFTRVERRDVALKFGDVFATALDSLPMGGWSGPVESGYGLHLVLIRERIPGSMPSLAEARPVVLREVQNERRLRGMDQLYEKMRAGYQVRVEWPGADSAGAKP